MTIEATVTFARALDNYDGREGFVTELAAVPHKGDWFYLDEKGYRNLKSNDYQETCWQVACVTHHMRWREPVNGEPQNPITTVSVLLVPLPQGAAHAK